MFYLDYVFFKRIQCHDVTYFPAILPLKLIDFHILLNSKPQAHECIVMEGKLRQIRSPGNIDHQNLLTKVPGKQRNM